MKQALLGLALSPLTCLLAQKSPTTPKAARVQVIEGPAIELAREHLTIVRWTANNPGGSPVHYGVVHYGTDPNRLTETAKSPIRMNPEQALTVFRVRLDNLKSKTTYYFRIDSTQANGERDGATSTIRHFKTP
jgi:UDP-N-acetylmuramyl tripeptide synthase